MSIKIDAKIVGYEVVKPENEIKSTDGTGNSGAKEERSTAKVIRMTEQVKRPEGMESLEGST